MSNDDYNKSVLVVVYARACHNITVMDMAKRCGVSRQAIHDFETHKTISHKLLLKYMTILLDKDQMADMIEKWGK